MVVLAPRGEQAEAQGALMRVPPSQEPWTPSQARIDGERLNAIDALRLKLKEAEARQTGLAAEVGANARSIAELSKRIEQLREDMPKMLTGAGGGKRTIRKVLERDGSEWLPDIVEPIVAPLVGPAVNTALSAAIGVTIQGYDADLAAWALVNPSQFSTTAQIAAAYQPLSSVLTNTTASFTTALLTKLNGIAAGATANDTDANLKNRANHTGTQSADTITDGTTNKAFLAAERTKLAGIATGATANDTDANLKARANHTGTQTASTISDFSTAADGRISAAIGVTVQAHASVLANTTASFTSALLTKLNGIATGATANDTDANLKNRANHTGTQAISTVSGLSTALTDANPLGYALFWARDEKAQNTPGGAAVVGPNERTLNTLKVNEISGASLASNVITLPAGTYYIVASAPAYAVDGHKLTLVNSSTFSVLLEGPSCFNYSVATADVTRAELSGRLVVPGGGLSMLLRHFINTAKIVNGLGVQINNSGLLEVYTDIKIWKVKP